MGKQQNQRSKRGGRNRAIASVRCPTGKSAFRSYDAASGTAATIGAERVYRCPECGSYHVTRYTRGENDALGATRLGKDELHRQNQTAAAMRWVASRGDVVE